MRNDLQSSRPAISELWQSLSTTLFANIDDEFINSFRRPGGANARLGVWDPADRSMRYFKFMLYMAAMSQPKQFFRYYRKIANVNIGSPISVTVNSCSINLDYLLSVQEQLFLEKAGAADKSRSIIEIGAGFGRTCHTLLSLNDKIGSYTIIDLPNMLELSRRVLLLAIPKLFYKIQFVDATNINAWRGMTADLVINIDSFQEISAAAIDAYMNNLVAHCKSLYTKNPIAKYDPTCIGITLERQSDLEVFSLGYCRDVIDVFDEQTLIKHRCNYVAAYRPSESWSVVADEPCRVFQYYHHALYRRSL